MKGTVCVRVDNGGLIAGEPFGLCSGILDEADQIGDVLRLEELFETFGHEAARLGGERLEIAAYERLFQTGNGHDRHAIPAFAYEEAGRFVAVLECGDVI